MSQDACVLGAPEISRLQGRGRYFEAAAAAVPASPAKGSKFPGSELPPLAAVTPRPASGSLSWGGGSAEIN